MKTTVIYGEHITAARKRFSFIVSAIRKRGWEVINVEVDKTSLAEKLTYTSLFGENQLFVIENAKQFDASAISWLTKNLDKFEGNILIYHEGQLPVEVLNIFKKNGKIEKFDLPKTIFSFLESIYPGNAQSSLKAFHEVIEHEPPELVFALICSNLRDVYWAKLDPQSMSLPDWRQRKLISQASRYSSEKLVQIIEKLAEIDIKVKTSQAEIRQSLDQLIASELQ